MRPKKRHVVDGSSRVLIHMHILDRLFIVTGNYGLGIFFIDQSDALDWFED
jgi:hypothetical protein